MAFKSRLTAREVQTATRDLCDGSGLWLQVTPALGGKSWLLRYRFDGARASTRAWLGIDD